MCRISQDKKAMSRREHLCIKRIDFFTTYCVLLRTGMRDGNKDQMRSIAPLSGTSMYGSVYTPLAFDIVPTINGNIAVGETTPYE